MLLEAVFVSRQAKSKTRERWSEGKRWEGSHPCSSCSEGMGSRSWEWAQPISKFGLDAAHATLFPGQPYLKDDTWQWDVLSERMQMQ